MKTLLEYYENHCKDELESELSQYNSPNKKLKKIQKEINILRNINGEYIQKLTPSQARIALRGLADIDRSLDLIAAVIPPDSPLESNVKDIVESSSKKSYQGIINIAALSGGAGGFLGSYVGSWLIQESVPSLSPELLENIKKIAQKAPNISNKQLENGTTLKDYYIDFSDNILYLYTHKEQLSKLSDINPSNPVLPIGIGLLTGILIAGIIALIVERFQNKQLQTQPQTNLASPQVNQNQEKLIEYILGFLYEKFKNIDNQVAKKITQEKPKPPTPKLEDHPDILNFFQRFMGYVSSERDDAQSLTNELNQQLPALLYQNGIQVEFYQPGIEDTSKFDFVKNIDPEVREYVNLTPALIKDNKVIKRGRVVKPASL